MFEFKPTLSNQSRPQPQHYQSLPHSSKHAIFNPCKFNNFHTLGKTTRGIPFPSHFGTRPGALEAAKSVDGFAIAAFAPPAATRRLRIQSTLREPPPLVPQGPGNSVFQIDG